MSRILFFGSLFLIMLASGSVFGQKTVDKTIRSIEFEGLKKTKANYLAGLIESRPGILVQDSLIVEDVQRLKNTVGIGNAVYRIDTIDQVPRLVFTVNEVQTLLPIINFGGISGNLWFQVGFSDINWRGRGQSLAAHYQNNDGRHAGQIYYRAPRIKGSQWGGSISLSHWASREPLFFPEGTVNYDYDNSSFALTAIRHFGFRRSLEFGGSFFVEQYQKSEEQFLENPPGPDQAVEAKVLSKIEYQEDFLNYHFFYRSGFAWKLTYQNVYGFRDRVWFNSLQFQGRKYIQLGKKINFAFRLQVGIASNNDTPFAPFVADSHVNLRGVGNRIDRGTAQVVLNAEYRHTVLHTNRWAIQLAAFSDVGSWRNPGGQLEDLVDPDNFKHFVGGGIRIIYPKVHNAVIRVDYGVGVFTQNTRGLVIGFGQYF